MAIRSSHTIRVNTLFVSLRLRLTSFVLSSLFGCLVPPSAFPLLLPNSFLRVIRVLLFDRRVPCASAVP